MSADLAARYREHLDVLGRGTAAVLAAHDLDALVIAAGAPALKSRFDDQHWPQIPTPTFAHWLPLPEPDAVLVIRPGARPHLIRVASDDYWELPARAESDHFWASFEVIEVKTAAGAADHLPRGRVAVIASGDLPFAPPGPVNPPALVAALEQLRTRKTPYEIACIAEASRRAVRGHKSAAERFAASQLSELGLHLDYLAASDQDDADTPYKNIVARGSHAAVLHWVTYDRRPGGEPDSLLVDAGARYLGYACDITRTWVRGAGAAADAFSALVDGVDRLQRRVCAEIRVGDAYEALHDRSHQLLAEVLVEIGLGRGAPSTLVERGVTRALFPHGLGHSLGLQVHDVGLRPRPPRPENRFLRNTSTIEAGQVFTIEPGCYVIDALLAPLAADDRKDLLDWRLLDALRPFGGVRIEDDVVVTVDGVRNLTREAWAETAA